MYNSVGKMWTHVNNFFKKFLSVDCVDNLESYTEFSTELSTGVLLDLKGFLRLFNISTAPITTTIK